MARTLIFSHEYSRRQSPPVGAKNYDLDIGVDILIKKFNLCMNFWKVSARVYSFHKNICSGKSFGTDILPCDHNLGIWH